MPAIVVQIIRFLIQLGILQGVSWLLNATIFKWLDYTRAKTLEAVYTIGGYSKEEAEAAADELIQEQWIKTARDLGVMSSLLYAKIPQAATEKIGLTSKGWSNPITKGRSAELAAKVRGSGPVIIGSTPATIETVAQAVVATGKGTFTVVNNALSLIAKVVGIPVGILFTLAQFIDYAAWNGSAYQSTFQKVLAKLGVAVGISFNPDTYYPKSTALSAATFDKLFLVYQELGVKFINDPYKEQVVTFTRQNLVDITDKVAAHFLAEKGKASFQDVYKATQLLMGSTTEGFGVLIPATAQAASTPTTTPSVSTAGGGNAQPAAVAVPRVFTGVVSQGTLGQATDIVARQSDLISNMSDLNLAAANNLAPFIAALPGRITYRIKITSTAVGKDGFKQTGTAQKIITGYYKNGQPKYKNIINKFAVLDIYLKDYNNKQIKIYTLTLGPTDAVLFQPTQQQIQQTEATLVTDLVTSDIKTITSVKPGAGSSAVGAAVLAAFYGHAEADIINITQLEIPLKDGQVIATAGPGGHVPFIVSQTQQQANSVQTITQAISKGGRFNIGQNATAYLQGNTTTIVNDRDGGYATYDNNEVVDISIGGVDSITKVLQFINQRTSYPIKIVNGAPPVASPQVSSVDKATTPPVPVAACSATTLSNFYTAQGKQLPTVTERSKIYEQLNLGPAAWYTGSAEQNTKLLAAIKQQIGCG